MNWITNVPLTELKKGDLFAFTSRNGSDIRLLRRFQFYSLLVSGDVFVGDSIKLCLESRPVKFITHLSTFGETERSMSRIERTEHMLCWLDTNGLIQALVRDITFPRYVGDPGQRREMYDECFLFERMKP